MRKRMSPVSSVVCLCVFLSFNAPALAGDINPPPGPITSTMKTLVEVEPRVGVQTLPGSASAVHVISEPGSYYLTGNITGLAGKNGIEVASDNVSIDLNGFVLLGSAEALSAVAIPETHSGLLVQNGLIQGWPGVAIAGLGVSNKSVIRDLTISMPMGGGIAVGNQSFISRCVIETEGTSVVVGEGSIVRACTITSHGSIGISATGGPDIHILDCIIRNGGNDGIRAGSRTVIRNCSVNNNRRAGIRVSGDKAVIIGNTCNDNGQGLVGHGIFADSNFGSRVEGNYCAGNDIGIQVTGPSAVVIRNIASGNGTNYLISGVVSSTPATASPWANLEN